MQKIIIPHLTFSGEKITVPAGLSELLEPYWSLNVDRTAVNEIADQYNCQKYKNENGNWVSKFTIKNKSKAGETNEH
ncbi:hypothetical protein [Lysinibacillus capsici]|uniref:hypothetical protein n=1 Tax=Lysinibacillus capsici TaxID=2115968 RepID=UPI002A7F2AA8|nr:hypothetical protein [Lysinibacillus capsici]MED4701644.1 hypothetical protein [Lysinibacillus capsici]